MKLRALGVASALAISLTGVVPTGVADATPVLALPTGGERSGEITPQLSGQVASEGFGVPFAMVTAVDAATGDVVAEVTAAEDGVYGFGGLADGAYDLFTTVPGNQTPFWHDSGYADLPVAVSVDIVGGLSTSGAIDFELPTGGFGGYISGPVGPLADATLTVVETTTGFTDTVAVLADGNVGIGYIPVGTYEFTVSWDDGGEPRSFTFPDTYATGENGLSISLDVPAPDVTAPVLESLSVSPASVDTTGASRELTVTARIVDDSSGMVSAGFVFRSPSGEQALGAVLDAGYLVSGTGLDGVFERKYSLPQLSETGVWTVDDISLTDAAGNLRTFVGAEAAAAGYAAGFANGPLSVPVSVSANLGPGPGSVTVEWAPPITDGGSVITMYQVEKSDDGGATWTDEGLVDAPGATQTVGGLTAGREYLFKVRAHNGALWGPFSDPVAATPFAPLTFEPSDFYTSGNPLPAKSAEQFGEGAFRFSCRGGHLNYDDPIVFPGQQGASHLHQYFGNLEVDSSTTLESLESVGETTCQGGPLNRSGYWVPALIDGADDTVIPIGLVVVYYKGEPEDRSSILMGATSPLPEDLVMVADDYSWSCGDDRIGEGCTSQKLTVRFGSCWNGALDSGDHRSHVVFPERDDGNTGQLFCPESHPTIIPRITYNIDYDLAGASGSENWYLASDRDPAMAARVGQSVPAVPGSTAHGDYMEGWSVIDEVTGDTADRVWWEHCLLGFRSSPFGQLCDGRDLTWPGSDIDQPQVPVAHAISGQVASEGFGVPFATVTAVDAATGDVVAEVTAGEDGVYGFGGLADGSYDVFTTVPGNQARFWYDSGYANPPVTVSIDIVGGLSTSGPIDFELPSGGFGGYITGESGPLADATLMVVETTTGFTDAVAILADGNVGIGYIPVGTYEFTVTWDDGGELRSYTFPNAYATGPNGLSISLDIPAPDVTAPVLESLSVSPASVDTSGASRELTVTARITDDSSGLGSAGFVFRSPSGEQAFGAVLDAGFLVSGTGLDGVFERTFSLPRLSETGVWTVDDISLTDAAGNTRTFVGPEAAAAGYSAGFANGPLSSPVSVSAVAGPGLVSVEWGPPVGDGGSAIVNYQVWKSDDGGAMWAFAGYRNPPVTALTLYGLTAGSEYLFKVRAHNGVRWGLFSDPVAATPLGGALSSPVSVSAVAGPGLVSVEWGPPVGDGGSAIVNYQVWKSDDGGAMWAFAGYRNPPVTALTLYGLTAGSEYLFKVRAHNGVRWGLFSDPVAATPLGGALSSPVSVSAVAGPGLVSVEWGPPVGDGGSAIVNYQVWKSDDGGAMWAFAGYRNPPVTALTLYGLTAGSEYLFKVRAHNGVRWGLFSDPVAATPLGGALSSPVSVSAVAGPGLVSVEWGPPVGDGGSAIVNYQVWKSDDGGAMWAFAGYRNPPVTALTLYGLTAGSEYLFKVRAHNGVRWGLFSDPVAATPLATSSVD